MAMTGMQLNRGMQVVGSNGDEVGKVKEVRRGDFLVDRSMQRDVYVPFDAVRNVTGDTIALNCPAGQVDNMGWANPALTGQDQTATTTTGTAYRCQMCGAEFATRQELDEHNRRMHGM